MHLVDPDDLPDGVSYPVNFVRMVDCGLIHVEPWRLLVGAELRDRISGLRERFPDREWVPFARRQDNDDVACWEAGRGREVVLIHDFTTTDRVDRGSLPDFDAWLRQAIEDFIDFEGTMGS